MKKYIRNKTFEEKQKIISLIRELLDEDERLDYTTATLFMTVNKDDTRQITGMLGTRDAFTFIITLLEEYPELYDAIKNYIEFNRIKPATESQIN